MERIIISANKVEDHGRPDLLAEWFTFRLPDGTVHGDRWLQVSLIQDGETILIDPEQPEGIEAHKRASSARIKELQTELGIHSDDYHRVTVAERIIDRAWSGEWMGQKRNSLFYIQDLTAVMAIPLPSVAQLIASLNLRGKVGLNGAILIPFEDEAATFKKLESETGHKRLYKSDFGQWYCQHCGNSGSEEEPWATEVPCIP